MSSHQIFKYALMMVEDQTLSIPWPGRILSVQTQEPTGALQAWVEVDTKPGVPQVSHRIRIVGTGHPMPDANLKHIATVQSFGLVWHIFVTLDALPIQL